MKLKRMLFWGVCALSMGLGAGISMAQSIPDNRCQDCQTFFYQCITACDYEGGEGGCYASCIQQRRLCQQTFCN
jgi:hypothetical protein